MLGRIIEDRVNELHGARPVLQHRLFDLVHHFTRVSHTKPMPFEAAVVGTVDAMMGASALALDIVAPTQALVRSHVHPVSDFRRLELEGWKIRLGQMKTAVVHQPDAGNLGPRLAGDQCIQQAEEADLPVGYDDRISADATQHGFRHQTRSRSPEHDRSSGQSPYLCHQLTHSGQVRYWAEHVDVVDVSH